MIKKIFHTFILLIILIFVQCENGDKTISCFPDSTIGVDVNLDLPQFQRLSNINGWAYVGPGALSGTRGLIVVRTGQYEFKAYDRNAPHICPADNTTLEVVDDFYIYCPKDGAKWMFRGDPMEGSTTGKPPKMYNAQLSGNRVYISN